MPSRKSSIKKKKELLKMLNKSLKSYILPKNNEVEIEISRPPIEDVKRTAIEGHGMYLYSMPGPDIYIRIHVVLKREVVTSAQEKAEA